MRNFQDVFETRKGSLISVFFQFALLHLEVCMTFFLSPGIKGLIK